MSFPRATEMFQFTRFASHSYEFTMRYPEGQVSPFRNLRIKANLPAPRSLSQAITSFVAYHCQGIHHMLLVTWPYNFDTSFEIKIVFKDCIWQVSHLSRYAVMWIIHRYFYRENNSSLLKFKMSFNTIEYSFWRNQKMSLAARSVLNLYECTVSASNANSTLWIFKEQPWVFRLFVNW